MPVDVIVPAVGESITEVFIGTWLKKQGEAVAKDEPIVEIETDKATLEVPAPVAGVLSQVHKADGDAATVGEAIATIDDSAAASAEKAAPASAPAASEQAAVTAAPTADKAPATADSVAASEAPAAAEADAPGRQAAPSIATSVTVMPAAQRLLEENNLMAEEVRPTGPGGRLTKEDVLRTLAERERQAAVGDHGAAPTSVGLEPQQYERQEEVVRMSPLRRMIAQRLVEAQHNAALLTTFNEIDMSAVIGLRKEYRESFEKRHGIRLGFMSFFIKATVEALKEVPQINAEVRDDAIVYKNYYDIGVAVSSKKGLIVPVIRNAERLSFAEVEKTIADFGARAGVNKLKPDELQGGTFTISNGGVFGSLMSTPIVNPPQSGVLGMHTIQERPVAIDGAVVIRPMMYVALTYDHRVVDGREAVTFLKRIKEAVERPTRILLEV